MLSKRNRLISFRLSEQEFLEFEADCFEKGSRSLSDHARILVSGMVQSHTRDRAMRAEGSLHRELRHVVDQVFRLIGVAESLESRARISAQDRAVVTNTDCSQETEKCDSL